VSDSNVIKLAQPGAFADSLTEILRSGARAPHRPGAGEQGLAPEPMELCFKRRSPRLFHHLQPGGERRKCRFGPADRQLRVGLQRQQYMLDRPKTEAVYSCAIWASPFSLSPETPSAHPSAQRANACHRAMCCCSQIRKADPAESAAADGSRRKM